MHGLARLLGKIEQPIRVVEQQLALGGEVQLLALAHEKLDAEVAFELAHAGGDVGLDAVELFGGARDAAGLHHRAEDMQVGEIHRSHLEMIMFIIIHFT